MNAKHGGCGGNPPDYAKYVLKQHVSDEALQAFYDEYPKFRSYVVTP